MAGTFLTGPIIDFQLNSGVVEVLAYRYAFLAATMVTAIGFLIFFTLIRKMDRPKSTYI